jgi:hypothetical protein
MKRVVMMILVTLIAALPVLLAQTNKEILQNVTLDSYTCDVKASLLFFNYNVTNHNKIEMILNNVILEYQILYQDETKAIVSENDQAIIETLTSGTEIGRKVVKSLSAKNDYYKITSCKAQINKSEITRKVWMTKTRTIEVKTGEKMVVAPDCKDDYAKLQAMKPGVEKREFADKLIHLGCITFKDVYGKKTESYGELDDVLVDPKQ